MYAFYMDGLQLPVTPAEMTMSITNQNKTISLINDGEVNILKVAGLTDISFTAVIPQARYPFAVYKDGFKDAAFFLDKFEKLKIGQKPFQFIVSRVSPAGKLLFDTNMAVSLEEYEITEDAENGMDLEVSFKLKQYRAYGTKKAVVKQESSSAAKKTVKAKSSRSSSKTPPKTHKVVSGDTLWALCKKYLGNGSRYPEIAKLNKIPNPDLIYPGQVIKFA
ncbi:LysM peptidoglycan-binding domain-containing protein [Cytobacillus gottheilii]|uniref:LysM peptidoglycan-binding domain-containing protein n=1 Tax=Cytobacillus gottheilii TaxID=859144 RepID=A0ABX8FBT7_9BACI|nr:LysM domain-containing protein [Cytobacillus gottheilii]QVY60926.1 LysM peptidoglycan-binding domain-containing protein [Cytobacillus gottheilii]